MMQEAHIRELAKTFLEKVFQRLSENGVHLGKWSIDHLCYRTSSEKNYVEVNKFFSKIGNCLIESEVNGRLISTYKLFTPIEFDNKTIELIEIPAPKTGKETQEGFEHFEVVIDIPFNEIINKYPNLNFKQSGMNKELNPELGVDFGDCAIKFHHQSLEDVIAIEKELAKNNKD